MTESTTRTRAAEGWAKPYDGFPLSYHPPSGRLYKKIKGRRCYFGYAADWQAAVDLYNLQRDDLYAGRKPRDRSQQGPELRDIVNAFLAHKEHQRDVGEITPRSFSDYFEACGRLVDYFGRHRLVDDITPEDFGELRRKLAKTWGLVRLSNEINRLRMPFGYAYKNGLIDKPVRFGDGFARPSKRALRKQRQKAGPRMFEREQLLAILDAATQPLRAMILLGVNAGLGNADCGTLPAAAIGDDGWVDFPRPKTGIHRRFPLWPETLEAVQEAIDRRPSPRTNNVAGLAFLTKQGSSFHKLDRTAPLSAEFRKLLNRIDKAAADKAAEDGTDPPPPIYRPGLGFYALRHTFETIGGEARDQVAVDAIMGHVDSSMAGQYRERISDERLRRVTDHVRGWLFAEGGR